ncbi:SH3PXD2A [Branchiostoma lanceolatum]|uniref:SH3PXD2A protein n=1 Tax=Branchiostoma lanceolatum TaxID=7740 RepID=A0A8J9W0I7_BRALA|nr:SH3PXD2A [Branchiostoma lanceolatum]
MVPSNNHLSPGPPNTMNYADIDFKNMPAMPAKPARDNQDGDNGGLKPEDLTSMYATILPKHMRPNKGAPDATPSDVSPADRKRMAVYNPEVDSPEPPEEPSTPPLPDRTEEAADKNIPEVTTTPPDDLDDFEEDFNPNYARIDLKDLVGLKLSCDSGGRNSKRESCTDSISADEIEEEGASAAPDSPDTPSHSPGQQKRHTYVNIKPDGHAYVNVEPKSKSNREPKGVLFYAVTDYSPMQMHRQGIPLKAGDVVEVYSFDQDWCFVVSYPKSCSKPIEGWVPRHILREMGTHCCVPTSPAAEDTLPMFDSLNLSSPPNRIPDISRDPSPHGRTGADDLPSRHQRDGSPKAPSTIAPFQPIGLEQRKSGSCENISISGVSVGESSTSHYVNKIHKWDSVPGVGMPQPSPPSPRRLGGDQSPWHHRKFAPPSPPPVMAPLSGATSHGPYDGNFATAVAVCDYTATLDGCISCRKGDHGQLLDVNSRGWWYVRIGMVEGWVPGDYWEVVKHSQPRVPGHRVSPISHSAFRGPRYFGFETEPWYHGRLSRHEAESRLLRYARSRDFLVRQSTHRRPRPTDASSSESTTSKRWSASSATTSTTPSSSPRTRTPYRWDSRSSFPAGISDFSLSNSDETDTDWDCSDC